MTITSHLASRILFTTHRIDRHNETLVVADTRITDQDRCCRVDVTFYSNFAAMISASATGSLDRLDCMHDKAGLEPHLPIQGIGVWHIPGNLRCTGVGLKNHAASIQAFSLTRIHSPLVSIHDIDTSLIYRINTAYVIPKTTDQISRRITGIQHLYWHETAELLPSLKRKLLAGQLDSLKINIPSKHC